MIKSYAYYSNQTLLLCLGCAQLDGQALMYFEIKKNNPGADPGFQVGGGGGGGGGRRT